MIHESDCGKNKALRCGLAVAGLLGAAVTPALANLIAYEGFNHPPTQVLAAAGGGIGWGLNWSIDGSAFASGIMRAASLNGDRSIATSGHALSMGSGTIYSRALASTLGTTGTATTRWMGLFYLGGATTTVEHRIGLYSGMGDGVKNPEAIPGENTDGNTTTSSAGTVQVMDFGRTTAATGPGDVISFYLNNNGTGGYASTGVSTPRGSVAAFLLLRFDLDGGTGNDAVSMWVNPNPGAGEGALGTAQATWTVANLDLINGFRLQNGNGAFYVDEIRIGTTFADVTPPAPTQGGQITLLTPGSSDVNLVWDSFGDGQNYTVHTSPTMGANSWTPAATAITDGILKATVSRPAEDKAFFRVTSP